MQQIPEMRCIYSYACIFSNIRWPNYLRNSHKQLRFVDSLRGYFPYKCMRHILLQIINRNWNRPAKGKWNVHVLKARDYRCWNFIALYQHSF